MAAHDARPGSALAVVVAGALVAGALVASACAPNHQADGGPMAADTVRGIVDVTGAEPLTGVVVRTAGGDLRLAGPIADDLRPAAGIEVWVAGSRAEDGSLLVESYRVRSVDGIAAVDGVLELEGADAVLVTATGERVRFDGAPPGLRGLVGQRIWIAGPPGGHPQAWGVLASRP